MLSIPTHVVLTADDPELIRARAAFGARLRLMVASDEQDASIAGEYLVSAPFREDDGAIVYVHVFRAAIYGRMQALGVSAAPGWWPVAKASLAPRRTAPRARLRLVS